MDSALTLIHSINQYIINPIIVLMFAVAILVFLYGMFEYFIHGASSTERETGSRHIIAGVVGIFIMVSVFGIINIVINTIGANTSSSSNIQSSSDAIKAITK